MNYQYSLFFILYECVLFKYINSSEVICPDNQKLEDKNGHEECVCMSDFEMDSSNNCERKTDKCAPEHTPLCPSESKCKKKDDSYECICPEGKIFKKNGGETKTGTCVNIHYCDSNSECGKNSNCLNNNCVCDPGFKRESKQAARSDCVDVDECKGKISRCGENMVCVNNDGSYTCKCKEGYEDYKWRPGTCIMIADYCNGDSMKCEIQNTTCESNKCICNKGLQKIFLSKEIDSNKYKCEARVGCETDSDICDSNSVCVDENNSYSCECNFGYKRNKLGVCVVEEILCKNSSCSHIKDSFCDTTGICKCHSDFEIGFLYEGKNDASLQCIKNYACYDEKNSHDKCATKITNSVCSKKINYSLKDLVNNEGCKCNEFYKWNEKKTECLNIDKCLNENVCEENLSCKILNGSNNCVCNKGYEKSEKNGTRCIDINECLDQGICPKDSVCKNKPGSYKCGCKIGEIINPLYINSSISRNLTNYCLKDDNDISTCVDKENNCDHETQYCFTTINKKTLCECKPGYHNDKDKYWLAADDKLGVNKIEKDNNNECLDVDECKTFKEQCGVKATCKNIAGGYKCTKNDGAVETYYRNLVIKEKHVCSNESYWYKERCRSVNACKEFLDFCETAVHSLATCTADEKGNSFCGCKNGKSKFVNGSCIDSGDADEDSHIFIFSVVGGFSCLILILIAFGIFKTVKKKRRYGKQKYLEF